MNNRRDTEVSTTVIVVVLSSECRPPTLAPWQRSLTWLFRAAVIALLTIF